MDDDHADNYTPLFAHKNSYDLNSKIMLTAIISLSLVVAVVTILHVYARCVLTRQARRRAAIRALSLSIAQAQSRDTPKTGLDQTVISAMPVFKFKQSDGQGEATSTECTICLSLLEDGKVCRMLPNCKHCFHMECIDIWLGSQSTCPVCRTKAKPWLAPEPREPPSSVAIAIPATPLEGNESEASCLEGTSSGAAQNKTEFESSSHFNSIRRMLSRERSSRRIQIEDVVLDLERQ